MNEKELREFRSRLNVPIADEDANVKHFLGEREEGHKLIIWSQFQNTQPDLFEEQKRMVTKCMQMKDSRFYAYEEAWICQ